MVVGPSIMKLQHAMRVTTCCLILFASFWCHVAFSRGTPNYDSQSVSNPSTSREQELVRAAVDLLTIEIAKGYLASKGTTLPKAIDSVATLQEFLSKTYPDKNHELRRAVVNLQAYGDSFVGLKESDSQSVGSYLRDGVKRYAVNLKGQPMIYDSAKIARIIDQTSDTIITLRLKPPVTEKSELVGASTRSSSRVNSAAGFIRLHSLLIVAVLLTTNLLSLLVIFRMRSHNKDKLTVNSIGSVSVQPVQATKANNVRIKAINPDNMSPYERVVQPQVKRESVSVKQAENELQILPVNSGVHWGDWLVVRASVPGKLHIDSEPQIPCQDSNTYRDLGSGWGIAIVCDGAGSKKFSHYGSTFVTDLTANKFADVVKAKGWLVNASLPSDDEWHGIARNVFTDVRCELDEFARNKYGIDVSLLGCTVIVVVHSPIGILASHVGDGRAAFYPNV